MGTISEFFQNFFFLNVHIEGNHYIAADFDKKLILLLDCAYMQCSAL